MKNSKKESEVMPPPSQLYITSDHLYTFPSESIGLKKFEVEGKKITKMV